MTPDATAADAAGYARWVADRSVNCTALSRHGCGCAGCRRDHCAQQPVDRLRQVDAADRRARLKRVVGERLDDAGARDRHDPGLGPVSADIGDDAGVGRIRPSQQRRQPHADQRREIAAGDLRRALDRAVLLGQPRQLEPRARSASRWPRRSASVRSPARRVVRLERALEVAARLRAARRSAPATRRRPDRARPPGGSARAPRSASPVCRSTAASSRYRNALSGELAIAALVQRASPRRAVRPRRLARSGRGRCSSAAEPQHFDARAADPVERRVGGERGLECRRAPRPRDSSASSACPRPTSADSTPPGASSARSKCASAAFGSPCARARRSRAPSRPDRSRRRLQRRRHFALGVLQIAGLKEAPGAIVSCAAAGCRRAPRGTAGATNPEICGVVTTGDRRRPRAHRRRRSTQQCSQATAGERAHRGKFTSATCAGRAARASRRGTSATIETWPSRVSCTSTRAWR